MAANSGDIIRWSYNEVLGGASRRGQPIFHRGSVPHADVLPTPCICGACQLTRTRRCGWHFAMRRSIDIAILFRRQLVDQNTARLEIALRRSDKTSSIESRSPQNCTSCSVRRIHTCSPCRRIHETLDWGGRTSDRATALWRAKYLLAIAKG